MKFEEILIESLNKVHLEKEIFKKDLEFGTKTYKFHKVGSGYYISKEKIKKVEDILKKTNRIIDIKFENVKDNFYELSATIKYLKNDDVLSVGKFENAITSYLSLRGFFGTKD